MTKEEKIVLYKFALDKFNDYLCNPSEKHIPGKFLCNIIQYCLDISLPGIKLNKIDFPEFYKHAPEKNKESSVFKVDNLSGAWFLCDENGLQQRKLVLEQVIKDLQNV